MNDDPSQPNTKNWFNKVKQLFSNEPLQKEDLIEQLRDAELHDILDNEVLHIMEGALGVSAMQARDIMIPRSQMVCISANESPEDFLLRILAAGHSRYPVIGESTDEVLGVLLAKDLLPLLLKKNVDATFDLKTILRPAIFVPESKRLTILLREFRTNKNHMAIIADEYGGVAGLVTIEDVLEEIVGDIEDEYDEDADIFIKPVSKKEFMVKALTPIDEFNHFFHANLSSEEFDTIGGLVMQQFGHLPKYNESVVFEGFCFKVSNADSRRVRLLNVSVQNNSK